MAIRENTPTFKYVSVENLVITYNNKPYPIKNIYTNKKYLIWNIDAPNQLEESNVRPEESLLEYLIVINDNGVPTTLNHDNLILSFDAATNGFYGNADFDAIKEQVAENTKKYNTLIKDVDGITNIIGKVEELKDGTIIYNLNKIKTDSEGINVKLEEIKTQIEDRFKELKPILLDNLVEYLKDISKYKLSLTSLKNEIEITEDEKVKINECKENADSSISALMSSLDKLKGILDETQEDVKSQVISEAKQQLNKLHNEMKNVCDTSIMDNKLSDSEKTRITQKAYELSQYIGVVQNTCNNITVGGTDGIIYKIQNELLLYKDKTESNISELSREGEVLSNKVSSFKQTVDEIDLSVKKVTSEYKDDKEVNKIKENIISLVIEENSQLSELLSEIKKSSEDSTLSQEEKNKIQNKKDSVISKKNELVTEINKILEKLSKAEDYENQSNLSSSKDDFVASIDNLIKKVNEFINKINVNKGEVDAISKLIELCKTELTDLKNSCDRAMFLGFGGTVYEQLANFQVKSDGIISTVTAIGESSKGNIKSNVIKYYLSESETELIGGKWVDTMQVDPSKFVWIKMVTTYSDNTVKESVPTCINSKGHDGVTYYTWIRYADDDKGNGISNDPTNKEYIGFAYNKTTNIESNNPSDYMWSLIKGSDGINGQNGIDGKTYYTWIKYSDYEDGYPCYEFPKESTQYIGIATNKTSPTESDDPQDYIWSKFRGDNGVNGSDGVGVEEVVIEYAKNQSTSSPPYSGWSTNIPTYQEGYYLWTRTRVKYTNKSDYVYSTPTCDQSWKGISNVKTEFEQSLNGFRMEVSSGYSTKEEVSKIEQEINNVSNSIDKIENDLISGIFTDGIIDEAEAKAIEQHLQTIDREKKDVDAKYNQIYSNTYLK